MASILRSVTMDGLMHKIVRFYRGGMFELRSLPCGEWLVFKDGDPVPGVKVRYDPSLGYILEARS